MSTIVPISERAVVGGYPTGPGVYFVRAGDSGPIKIGKALVCIARRLRGLSTASPVRLELLAALPDPNDEGRIHEMFYRSRTKGEWFEPTEAMLSFLAEHKWAFSEADNKPRNARLITRDPSRPLGPIERYLEMTGMSMLKLSQKIGCSYLVIHGHVKHGKKIGVRIAKRLQAFDSRISAAEVLGLRLPSKAEAA